MDFLIAEYFEHVEEAVWAVEVLREVGAPVAVTMCIGPEGDMHDVTPGECAVKLARAGADIIGVNCRFGPWTSLQTMKLMKEGLRDASLQAHLMVQCLGFHTPDCGKGGFVDLPEYPFGLEPRVATRWDIQNTPERPTTWGSGTLAAAADLSPTTSGRLQRSWPQKGDFCHRLQKNMAAGEVVWTCTPNPGSEQGPERNTGRICE